MAGSGLARWERVLKGMVECDNPRAFYRGSWPRTFGVLLSLSDGGLAHVSFGIWEVTDAGLNSYVERGLWAVRHGG